MVPWARSLDSGAGGSWNKSEATNWGSLPSWILVWSANGSRPESSAQDKSEHVMLDILYNASGMIVLGYSLNGEGTRCVADSFSFLTWCCICLTNNLTQNIWSSLDDIKIERFKCSPIAIYSLNIGTYLQALRPYLRLCSLAESTYWNSKGSSWPFRRVQRTAKGF
jgi:hypothetical protein